MILYVLSLIAISYISFVFISDLFNPFVATKAPLRRRRWKLGRAAAIASMVAGVVAIALIFLNVLDERSALIAYLALGSLLIIPSAIQYKKSAIWQ